MKNSGNTKLLGDSGEDAAWDFYAQKDFSLIERNFRTRFGELDLIVQKGDLLVFAEVKALPNGNAEVLASELGPRKRRKIIETAKYFLKNHRQYSNKTIRFDVVVVGLPGFENVHLIEDAFLDN